MATTTNAGNIMLGRGKVYFDRLDSSGNATGERFLGNVTEFAVQTTDETREKFSSAEAAAPLMKRVVVRRTPEFSVSMDEYSMENLALILMGDESSYSQGAGAVTDENLNGGNGVLQGRYYKCANRKITAVTLEHSSGAPTYTLTDDYLIDAESGRIYIVPGGAIADATTIRVDYTPTAITAAEMVAAAKASVIEGLIRYIGDPASGPIWEVEVWKVSISPDGSMGLIGDDFGEFKITGAVLDDAANHATEPYYRMIKVADGT